MTRPRREPPRAFTASWPDAACTDPGAEVMRLLAVNLRAAVGDRSVREVGRLAGVDRGVVSKVLDGTAWVEAVAIARLERGLGVRLWPELGN